MSLFVISKISASAFGLIRECCDWVIHSPNSVQEALERSKHFLLVISPSYLTSAWGNFEMGVALSRAASALWYKAGEYDRAKDLALRWLQTGLLPPFAIHQLQELLSEVARIERLLEAMEEWRASAPISSSAREMLTKAVEEWRASAA
jgi:hypothetical protein